MNLLSKFRTTTTVPALLTGLLGCASVVAEYEPPSNVPIDAIVSASKDILNRPDIPLRGGSAYVEDIIRFDAA